MKLKTVQINMVDVTDWDGLVMKVYGRHYSLQQQNECYPQGTRIPVEIDPDNDPGDEYAGRTVPFIVNGDEMGVDFEIWKSTDPASIVVIDRYTREPVEKQYNSDVTLIYARNFYPSVDKLAYELYKLGHITETDFEIDCSW